jgi:hypothetical protein
MNRKFKILTQKSYLINITPEKVASRQAILDINMEYHLQQ